MSDSRQFSRSVAGLTVLVTGAAGGMGRATARVFAAEGAKVAVTDFNAEGAQAVAAEIVASGGTAKAWTLDVASRDDVNAIVKDIAAHFGGLDIVVNNAGISVRIAIDDEGYDEAWAKGLAVMLTAHQRTIRAALPYLRTSKCPRIVNIASDTALWGAPRLLAYVASKGAVISMTRSLARELGPRGIGVTVVAPGILQGESTDFVPAERHRLYEDGRAVPGPQTPEDIVDTVVFLLTSGALALTGQVLPVNAGFVFT